MNKNEITSKIIGAAIEVHKSLGPGLLERTYEECLCIELEENGLNYEKQLLLPIRYKNRELKDAYRIDVLVEKEVIVELKSVEKILNIHKAQLLTYMKLSNKKLGLLMNFNVDLLKNGIKRLIL
ncbi:GxxExxY protein [Orenia metallireducens]|uniref:GxxExxY protein n=1 Tax=Orenia metallireducens TaxID=1413210 RepID=A0A285FX17_9FIRM|nr:GxxExxY protein [Orenia metallireducens]SNY15364.1 GxxExxY protein [Orenia metallireducens]